MAVVNIRKILLYKPVGLHWTAKLHTHSTQKRN